MKCASWAVVFAGLGLAGCGSEWAAVSSGGVGSVSGDVTGSPVPHVLRPPGQTSQASVQAAPPTISYHRGAAPHGCSPQSGVACPGWIQLGVNIYFIWYGNWSGSPAQTILPDWASNLGGEPWYDITTEYWDAWDNYVPNWVGYGGASSDWYSQGTELTDSTVENVVANAINTKALPLDPGGLYFVLSSADVTHQGSICTQACGWHSWTNVQNTFIKYSIVPDGNTCPSVCGPPSQAPNDPGSDLMVNVMGHELAETVTDPLITAWYGDDGSSSEIGDLCAWNFGSTFNVPGGAQANIWLGDRYYLVQQLFQLDDSTGPSGKWKVNGHCALGNNGSSAWAAPAVSAVGNGGKCLDAKRDGTANGTKVQLWDCNHTSAQQWVFSSGQIFGPGGKCLDVAGANSADGTPVQLWDCNGGSSNQQWTFDGQQIVGLAGKCLDARQGGTSNGTQMQLFTCNQTAAQSWSLGSP